MRKNNISQRMRSTTAVRCTAPVRGAFSLSLLLSVSALLLYAASLGKWKFEFGRTSAAAAVHI